MSSLCRLAITWASFALLAACAPDAWQNVRAKEFNAYLDTVAAKCQPLWIGSTLYRRLDASEGPPGQYDQLLDLMSRLFYQRISPAEFRASMPIMAGDSRSAASVECMIAQLPAERPISPTGQR
jgi:hypothetical protein